MMNYQQNSVLVTLPNFENNRIVYPTTTVGQSHSAPITPVVNLNDFINPANNSIIQPTTQLPTTNHTFTDVSTKAQIIAEIENEIQRLRLLESLLLSPRMFSSFLKITVQNNMINFSCIS